MQKVAFEIWFNNWQGLQGDLSKADTVCAPTKSSQIKVIQYQGQLFPLQDGVYPRSDVDSANPSYPIGVVLHLPGKSFYWIIYS